MAAGILAAIAVPTALPSGSPGSAPSAAAVAVLADAARVAAQQSAGKPIGPGDYLYVKTYEGSAVAISGGGHTVAPSEPSAFISMVKQLWIAADGSGRQLVTASNSSHPILDQSEPAGTFINAAVYTGRLPLAANALERTIVQRFEGGTADNAATLQFAGTFLQPDATPQLRAALFRMIATIPGVTALGPLTDVLGRTGRGVGITEDGFKTQLIFSPASAAVLQEQRVDSSGHVTHYVAYSTSGIVGSTTAVPTH